MEPPGLAVEPAARAERPSSTRRCSSAQPKPVWPSLHSVFSGWGAQRRAWHASVPLLRAPFGHTANRTHGPLAVCCTMMSRDMLGAAKDNDVAVLGDLLARGADPNTANRVGQTALHIAAIWGSIEAGQLLIEHGADVNSQNRIRGSTPLHCAAQRDQTAFAKLLVAAGADAERADQSGTLPYEYADDEECRQALGAPSLELHEALLSNDQLGVTSLLISEHVNLDARDKDGRSALGAAAAQRDVKLGLIEEVLRAGADPNACDAVGMAPLHSAVSSSNVELVELLLRAGAFTFVRNRAQSTYRSSGQWEKRARDGSTQVLDDMHQTPLLTAMEVLATVSDDDDGEGGTDATLDKALRVVEVLIDHGASVNAVDAEQNNALHYALAMESTELQEKLVERMVRAGADTTCGNQDIGSDQTPLAWAAARNRTSLMAILMSTGNENINFPGSNGIPPLHFAARSGSLEALKALLEKGANPARLDAAGRTALDLATANRKSKCAELLSAQPALAEMNNSTVAEKHARALQLSGQGKFSDAKDAYSEALVALARESVPGSPELIRDIYAGRSLAVTSLSSMAGAQMKVKELESALYDARLAVKIDRTSPKGWVQLLTAQGLLGRHTDNFHARVQAGIAVDCPNDDELKRAIAAVRGAMKKMITRIRDEADAAFFETMDSA